MRFRERKRRSNISPSRPQKTLSGISLKRIGAGAAGSASGFAGRDACIVGPFRRGVSDHSGLPFGSPACAHGFSNSIFRGKDSPLVTLVVVSSDGNLAMPVLPERGGSVTPAALEIFLLGYGPTAPRSRLFSHATFRAEPQEFFNVLETI
jgi:hypothetical protein